MNFRTHPGSRLWAGAGTSSSACDRGSPDLRRPSRPDHGGGIQDRQSRRSDVRPYGAPLEEIFLNARASMTGLDLATAQGLTEARNRVHAAALSACKQLVPALPAVRTQRSRMCVDC